jgi:hypothetical protein
MSGTVTVSGGYVPGAADVVTTSKLNRMVSEFQARVGAGEIGTRELEDGSIPLEKLDADVQASVGVGNGAVSTAKLADGAFAANGTGRAKMANGFVTADQLGAGAVETAKLADGAVTAGKLDPAIDGVANAATATVTAVQANITKGTWTNVTGLAAAITPTRTTSRVLVLVGLSAAVWDGAAYGLPVFVRVTRNGTVCKVGDSDGGSRVECMAAVVMANTQGLSGIGSLMFVDAPGSVAAQTYQVQVVNYGYNFHVNRAVTDTDAAGFYRSASSIVVMELLA